MGLRLPAVTSLLVASGGTWGFVGFPVGIFILLSCKLESLLPVCQDWGEARVNFIHKDTNALCPLPGLTTTLVVNFGIKTGSSMPSYTSGTYSSGLSSDCMDLMFRDITDGAPGTAASRC